MKFILLAPLIFFYFTVTCIAQTEDKNNENLHLKAYTNFRYDENRALKYQSFGISTIEERKISIGKISIALEQKINNNWSQEIELFLMDCSNSYHYQVNYDRYNFTITIPTESMKVFNLSLMSRYQIQYYFLNPENNFRLLIGAASGLKYESSRTKPLENTSFPKNINTFTIPSEIIAGFKYKISPCLSLDLQIPVEINNLIFQQFRIKDPSRPVYSQRRNYSYGVFLPKSFNLKFGLSYKF
jgi:hypothetical protein